jgi:hypothetical protein
MDGRVLTEIFAHAPAQRWAVPQPAEAAAHPPSESNGLYCAEEIEKIAQRLRCMGYVD